MDSLTKQVDYILNQKLYIADSCNYLSEEIYNNCFGLHITQQECDKISLDEFLASLKTIRIERLWQLKKSHIKTNLIYYSWVDSQAEQLRFNFISAYHSKLPFECNIEKVNTEKEIAEDYFASVKEDLLQLSLLKNIETDDEMDDIESDNSSIILKVYTEIIHHDKPIDIS